jgi:DNA-binding response OmpR family regulator
MGLQFVDLDDKQKVQLEKLINSLDESARKEHEGRKIILLAGGSDTARNINKSKLVLDGFYVLQATNADQVFEILQNETPDVMVLDWQETSFSSKGLLAQIRQAPQYDNVIIIVLAALTDSSAQREILDGGAEMYMAKMDTNPAKLSQTLSALIEERDN